MGGTAFEVSVEESGERLDRLVAVKSDLSRSAVRRLVKDGRIRVNGSESPPSHRVKAGELVEVEVPEESGPQPQEIPAPPIFEDKNLIVVDKPAGMVVHPGAGVHSGTLVNALLERGIAGGEAPERPGIVHRLDRETSGLLVVAKGEETYQNLVKMLSERRVKRAYRALVVGEGLPRTGTVDSPVGRDPLHPTLMAAGTGKPAVTHFEKIHEVAGHTMLAVNLETGRTHQIRVHLSAIGYPVYADGMYGKPVPDHRLWLHAEEMSFEHPITGEILELNAPIPQDLRYSARAIDESFHV
jgi:23S rRNA pseudouridine1911/1915/1917 synthase